MRISAIDNDEILERKIHWDTALLIAIQIIAMAMFGFLQTGTTVGAIGAVIIGMAIIFGFVLFGMLLKKLDKYSVRDELPLFLRGFLRRNPEIRSWFAGWVAIPLVGTLWFNSIFTWATGNYFVSATTILTIFLLNILTFLISTKFPDRSGRAIPFDDLKLLLSVRKLDATLRHFEKALSFFDQVPHPDNENCIKEAVCALEACVETLTGKPASRDFTKVLRQLEGKQPGQIPPSIGAGIIKLYAYRGDGQAVAHAALQGGKVSGAEAELVLNLAASYISYFCDLFPPESTGSQ